MSDYLTITYGSLTLTDYPYSIEFDKTDLGSPKTVVEVVESLLIDGDVEVSSRAGNRTLSCSVLVEGADFDELAENVEALAIEADVATNTFTVDPGDGFGAATRFETFRAEELPVDRSEAMEGSRLRRCQLTIRALPFGLSVNDVTETPVGTSIGGTGGTARQRLHTLVVKGSARTSALLKLEHETNSLGTATIYTYDDYGTGYVPALRAFLDASGTTTADASLVSGARNMLDDEVRYRIPAAQMPEGEYLLIARLRGSSAGAVELSVETGVAFGGTLIGGDTISQLPLTVTTGWANYQLGSFLLPSVSIGDPATADVFIGIVDNNLSGADIDVDEVWAYNLEIGSLTEIDCGTFSPAAGGASNRLFSVPASNSSRLPKLLTGTEADMSDARHGGYGIVSWGEHGLNVGEMKVFTVTTAALTAALTAVYTPRFYLQAVQL